MVATTFEREVRSCTFRVLDLFFKILFLEKFFTAVFKETPKSNLIIKNSERNEKMDFSIYFSVFYEQKSDQIGFCCFLESFREIFFLKLNFKKRVQDPECTRPHLSLKSCRNHVRHLFFSKKRFV